MPDDLTNRVCAMDERAAAPTPAPDPWIGVDMDALFGSDGPTFPIPTPTPASTRTAINGPMGPGIGM